MRGGNRTEPGCGAAVGQYERWPEQLSTLSPLSARGIVVKNASATALLVISAAFTGGCGEQWTGIVYPDKRDLTRSQQTGVFSTLEACRSACASRLDAMSASVRGDYECGLNCEANDDLGGILVCEKTVR